jgi:hypothetical protein
MVTTLKYGSKKDSINKMLDRLSIKSRRGVNTKKYSGIIKLKKDSLRIQKDLRNEWE